MTEQASGGIWDNVPIIASYTRAQAIEDGQLVDLSADAEAKLLLAEAAFSRAPMAMTIGAFKATILAGTTETPEGDFEYPGGQSFTGRLWDVLSVLRNAVARARGGGATDRVYFQVSVDTHGNGRRQAVSLWSLIGPGDHGEPVITVMLRGED